MNLVRQNFHEECEAGINRQINMELYASYLYLAMSQHFDREDVALPGFRKFFAKASEEEREHAIKREVNESLLALCDVAAKNNDSHFSDFLECEYLGEQVNAIKELADYVTNLRRCGPGLGEYIFDKETLHGGED
ncbi:Ferritin heavy chain [Taenia crassiceps]|uniref:Ferritin n=1 Tax=Taenia crassiceps TaxID=6207 RepID=A0ABR4Q5D4_9CEST